MNKPNIQNNIDSISSFQNGLNDLFSSPGFYFKSKVIEGNHKGKIIYFWLFGHFFLKCTFLWLWHFFLLSGYPVNSNFQWQYVLIRFIFWWSIFPLNYHNTYHHETFQGGDMLPVFLTHKYAWCLNGMFLLDHVTNKVLASACRRCMSTKLGKLLT